MLTFYQLIHGTNNSCPTIKDEIVRKYEKCSYITEQLNIRKFDE